MTFSICTAKLKSPPNGLLRHTGECREMISARHIERAFEFQPSDYEHCSSSDDSLGIEVGHLPMKPYIVGDPVTQNLRWPDMACYTFYFSIFY